MTNDQSDVDLDRYFRDGQSWAEDRQQRLARSQRLAWILTFVATTIAALEAIALSGLAPLKSVVPYMVLVDRQTGHVTSLDPSQPVRLSGDGALARSMLAQYVVSRETFDRSSIANDYRKVMLWSGGKARSSYLAQMKPDNPDNPMQRSTQWSNRAQVRSVSILQEGQALVRFDVQMPRGTSGIMISRPYVSVIRYRFRDRPLAEADRFINPLGFEVIEYRRDEETSPAPIPEIPRPASATTQPAYRGSL